MSYQYKYPELYAELARQKERREAAAAGPDPAMVEAARKEARTQAEETLKKKIERAEREKAEAEAAKARAEKELAEQREAQKRAGKLIEREKQTMAEQMEELRKKLEVASSSELAIFKLHFEAAQQSINKMAECLGRVNGAEAAKLRNAFLAMLEAAKEVVV